jgi:hypothetical protein
LLPSLDIEGADDLHVLAVPDASTLLIGNGIPRTASLAHDLLLLKNQRGY